MILVADTSGILAAFDADAPERSTCLKTLQVAGTVIVSPLVLAEVDHLARQRFGDSERLAVLDALFAQVRRMRFQVPDVSPELLDTARAVITRYGGLELDLADAVTVAVAAEYRTDALLTLDRRDFRAVRPLTPHPAFRLFPDDA